MCTDASVWSTELQCACLFSTRKSCDVMRCPFYRKEGSFSRPVKSIIIQCAQKKTVHIHRTCDTMREKDTYKIHQQQ